MWPEGAEHITKTTKRPLTAGTLFKNSMLALMKIIHSKVVIGNVIVNIVMVVLKTGKLYQEPHYIRCIKPNDAKSPVLFDQKLVEHQVHMMMMARMMMMAMMTMAMMMMAMMIMAMVIKVVSSVRQLSMKIMNMVIKCKLGFSQNK